MGHPIPKAKHLYTSLKYGFIKFCPLRGVERSNEWHTFFVKLGGGVGDVLV